MMMMMIYGITVMALLLEFLTMIMYSQNMHTCWIEFTCMYYIHLHLVAFITLSYLEEVHFSLNGRNYTNGSSVLIDDIGVNDSALHCVTSNTACCKNPKAGNFYYPDGVTVEYDNFGVYRTRTEQAVKLNLRDRTQVTLGIYACEIPDSSGKNQTIYINLIGSPEVYSQFLTRGIAWDASLYPECV